MLPTSPHEKMIKTVRVEVSEISLERYLVLATNELHALTKGGGETGLG